MAKPIEMRMFFARVTMDEIAHGVPFNRLPAGLFKQGVLQFRYRLPKGVSGGEAVETGWSKWHNVECEYEGVGGFDAAMTPPHIAAGEPELPSASEPSKPN